MMEIRKYSRKRYNLDENFDRGFVHYCLKSTDNFTMDKVMDLVAEIKKDFPNIKDEAISIYLKTKDELDLCFYSVEIPKRMTL